MRLPKYAAFLVKLRDEGKLTDKEAKAFLAKAYGKRNSIRILGGFIRGKKRKVRVMAETRTDELISEVTSTLEEEGKLTKEEADTFSSTKIRCPMPLPPSKRILWPLIPTLIILAIIFFPSGVSTPALTGAHTFEIESKFPLRVRSNSSLILLGENNYDSFGEVFVASGHYELHTEGDNYSVHLSSGKISADYFVYCAEDCRLKSVGIVNFDGIGYVNGVEVEEANVTKWDTIMIPAGSGVLGDNFTFVQVPDYMRYAKNLLFFSPVLIMLFLYWIIVKRRR